VHPGTWFKLEYTKIISQKGESCRDTDKGGRRLACAARTDNKCRTLGHPDGGSMEAIFMVLVQMPEENTP
jgi:hypothetical protein